VVLHVAGKPIELVHNDGVDVAVVLDAGEQCLELGAVGGAG
jgi:hypothetical protein